MIKDKGQDVYNTDNAVIRYQVCICLEGTLKVVATLKYSS